VSTPHVSVIMPAFDEEAFIAEAIESVLAQTHPAVELIVADDGSTDRTASIAERYGAQVVRQQHRGQAAARNAGLAVAHGAYWTVLDADDVMPPRRLERQVSYLEQRPDVGVVVGQAEAFVNPGEPCPSHFRPIWREGPFHGHCGTVLARAEVLATVGPFDEGLALGEDVDWLVRARDAGIGIGRVEELCLRYRVHAGNMSGRPPANLSATVGVLRASVRRRRAENAGG
jgi:glycosyltransferase involved in cell wall biosynthesis